jgi:hypothetical protein
MREETSQSNKKQILHEKIEMIFKKHTNLWLKNHLQDYPASVPKKNNKSI